MTKESSNMWTKITSTHFLMVTKVPPLSALSLALCHEALEGGGNHKMVTITSQKETSPLDC